MPGRFNGRWTLVALVLLESGRCGVPLEFGEPEVGAVFVVEAEIPVVLRAQVPNETVTTADVWVDGVLAGTATYCCPLCPCFVPSPGMLLELRIPREGGPDEPGGVWRGLAGLSEGVHRLSATATSSGGTRLESAVMTVTVLGPGALELNVSPGIGGALDFILPQGSLVPGGFDLWLSHDLREWKRLGPFQPGNVAAFYSDLPDASEDRPRYYAARPSQ